MAFGKTCKKKKKGFYVKININFCTSWYECPSLRVDIEREREIAFLPSHIHMHSLYPLDTKTLFIEFHIGSYEKLCMCRLDRTHCGHTH